VNNAEKFDNIYAHTAEGIEAEVLETIQVYSLWNFTLEKPIESFYA
jgi:hypothetical protein